MSGDQAKKGHSGVPHDELELRVAALDDLCCGVVVFGADGRVRYSNAAADGLTADLPSLFPVAEALSSGVASGRVERVLDKRGGKRVHVRVRTSPLRNPSGDIIGAVGCLIDVTDDSSRQRIRGLEAVVESMVDGVFVVDKEHRFTFASKVGAAAYGLRPEKVVGHRLVDVTRSLRLRHPSGEPLSYDAIPLVRALRGEVVRHMNKVVFNAVTGRDAHFRVNAAPVRDEEGNIVAAVEVTRDVTELVELETLKDEFIRVAAHELKTPVAVVMGYVEQLQRTAHDMPEGRRHMLDAIERGSSRMARIAQELVDVSQLHLGRMSVTVERVELGEIVQRTVATAKLTAREHRFSVTHLEPVVVRGDPFRIERVLGNLLDNAVRYSPGGGDVEIDVSSADAEAVITVTDRGVGIPKERQARIFERFYRAHTDTRHDFGGMGVGLYIGRELVRRMGGDLTFVSEEGKGSTFRFTLPLWGTHE